MVDFDQKRSVQRGKPPEIKVPNAGPMLRTEIARELARFYFRYDRYPISSFENNLIVSQAKLNIEWRKVRK